MISSLVPALISCAPQKVDPAVRDLLFCGAQGDSPVRYWLLGIPSRDTYTVLMRVIAKRTLRAYWEKNRRAEQPLKAWYAIAAKAEWSSPADVKAVYGNATPAIRS